ncbi:hypothetical protein KNV45_gp58 [uncultured phage cr271_1]|uniref:Uncharacterized protein n=1 Tax=uncultured phage cr271_1 TaxID=2772078 RepID=A0A7M1S041_9CAUD|nr:hypothetical protein KNV45_gp58 [uncultured phage cr271_1]QOR59906.1 hypothetical protein [uncultured phage cr271_1]
MAEISTGLMKKTKAQLIEIILRKDEVERECRTEISNLNKRIKGYDADIEGMIEKSKADKFIIDKQASMLIEKENLIEDMKSQFDISATEIAEVKEAIYMYKHYVKVLSISCAAFAIALICKLFVF